MAKKTLDITTREQLDVYMNPQRQRLLHEMQVLAQPATCKQLADAMGVSAVAVNKWVSGQAYPSADKLPQLARLLHTGAFATAVLLEGRSHPGVAARVVAL